MNTWLNAHSYVDGGCFVSFTPVCNLLGKDLGISRSGWWVLWWFDIDNALQAVEYQPAMDTIWLTPFLEMSPALLKGRLAEALIEGSFNADLLGRFPFRAILKSGLAWPTETVFMEALRWLPYFSFTPELSDLIKLKLQQPHSGEVRELIETLFLDIRFLGELGPIEDPDCWSEGWEQVWLED
jgi:hypothetical protein